MKRKLIAVASAAMIGLTAVAIPNQVEARWRGGGLVQQPDNSLGRDVTLVGQRTHNLHGGCKVASKCMSAIGLSGHAAITYECLGA